MKELRPGRGERSLRRAVEVLRDEGLRNFWFKLLGEAVYRRVDLVERAITRCGTPPDPGPEVQFELLQAGDIDAFLRHRAYVDSQTVLDRLARGDRCFLARDAGEIIHSCWAATGEASIDYLHCDVRLADDVVYVYEVYTSPSHRGRSISSQRSFFLEDFFRRRGFRRLLSVVWPENAPIFRSMEKAGYGVTGRMGFIGIGSRRHYFLRTGGQAAPLLILEPAANCPSAPGGRPWDAVPARLEGGRHYLDPFLAQLKRRANLHLLRQWGALRPDGALLKTDTFEEAMGDDAFLPAVQDEVGLLVGIDLAPAVVRRAGERYAGTALRFLAADVRHLPFADGCFSTVVSPSTLDHFPEAYDLGVSMRELYRVLEPGGRLVITLDNRQNLFDPLLRLVNRLGLVPYYLGRSYSIRELRQELLATGFEVRETTAILHNPRLVAVGTMRLVRALHWGPLIRGVQKLLNAAQGLERTRLRWYTGSFVAALAVRPPENEEKRP